MKQYVNTGVTKETQLKLLATELGFDYCGIAHAQKLDDDARRLEQWLTNGYQGAMGYMENYFEERTDPRRLFPGAKSVITLLLNYYPEKKQLPEQPQFSKYAYGKDYHLVIREKLNVLLEQLKTSFGSVEGRGFVDSAPVLERAWALKSGLGWIGKNGNLITKKNGSFFFIATLITDLELEADAAFIPDYCGTCTKCIDTCPTEAILPNKVVDGSKCISYFTIELKEAILPKELQSKFENWVFGCDICQDICPWNRFSKPNDTPAFTPLSEIMEFSWDNWKSISEEGFRKIFSKSAVKRTKFAGLQRNLKFKDQTNKLLP